MSPVSIPHTRTTRAERILSRLPPSLQKYTSRLRGAPVTHVAAFLILHEVTAVVPVLGLFGLFHYTDAVPTGYVMEHYGGAVREGVGRFERYFTRKGWFGFGGSGGDTAAVAAAGGSDGAVEDADADAVLRNLESGGAAAPGKYKIVVEVALAYAITKALLPVRIVGSVWATPWFAGVLSRLRRILAPNR
ncbi:hypothetical protein B0T24DRAFT_649486 [Lasiosphaeria ovina]|uniref:Uncharacterized protein n=1 Tax=Lasiosphaeria ovina TaxID=92902 RepID=A0AAE0KCV6_9PEZI|nr:hypothetical protein B0T24DRAFT_649486 [Lasiosphaeria ovina]